MKKLFYRRSRVWEYLMLIVGTAFVAVSIQCIYDPISLVTGGFSGLAIVIKAVTEPFIPGGIPLWLTNIALNIPVFLVAFKVKGKRFIGKACSGSLFIVRMAVCSSAARSDAGGLYSCRCFRRCDLRGTGMGLILLAKATTGGTDMVATIIQHYARHYSIVQILQILDAMVVLCGLYVFGLRAALYAIVAIFITTKVSDTLMEGFKFSKAAFIITDHYELVAKRILQELGTGSDRTFGKGYVFRRG